MAWLLELEPWLGHLIIGLWLVAVLAFASIAMVRAGLTPVWSLLLLVPVIGIVGLWVFAYARWPRLSDDPDQPSPLRNR